MGSLFIQLYQATQTARRIAVKTAVFAEEARLPFEDYLTYLRQKGVAFEVLKPREQTAIMHLFQFGGVR